MATIATIGLMTYIANTKRGREGVYQLLQAGLVLISAEIRFSFADAAWPSHCTHNLRDPLYAYRIDVFEGIDDVVPCGCSGLAQVRHSLQIVLASKKVEIDGMLLDTACRSQIVQSDGRVYALGTH